MPSHPDTDDEMWLDERIACHHCDLLLMRPAMREGQRSICPRCHHVISSQSTDGTRKALAFASAALVFIWLANTYPFLAFESTGLHNMITLPAASFELYRGGQTLLSVFVLGFIVIIPAAIAVILIVLLIALTRRSPRSWMVFITRLLYSLSPWSMAEVFIISVIVSLVKIAAMAEVELGIAFWSYILFTVCITAALAYTDRYYLWRMIADKTHVRG